MAIVLPEELPYTSTWYRDFTTIDLNWATQDGAFNLSNEGDIYFATGADELLQRLYNCMLTETGEIPHRPGYGVGLVSLQNAPATSVTLAELAAKIRSQLLNKDFFPEVVSVGDILIPAQPDGVVNINVTVETIYGRIVT